MSKFLEGDEKLRCVKYVKYVKYAKSFGSANNFDKSVGGIKCPLSMDSDGVLPST